MKKLLIVLLCVFAININAGEDKETLAKIRTSFYKAVEDEKELGRLAEFIKYKFSNDINSYPPRILAYFGALEAVSAKFLSNPFVQAKNVYSGMKKLNKAVDKSPGNLEVRFLRFSVLNNLPDVFGLGDDRDSDQRTVFSLLVKKKYDDLPRDIQKGLAEYLIRTNRLNTNDVLELKKVFPEIK